MKAWLSTRYLPVVAISALALTSLLFVATASASGPPLIEEESVSGITSTNATLEAQINPNGRAVYQFQLVTDPDEYASEILCPEPPQSVFLCIGEVVEGVLPVHTVLKEATRSLDLSSVGVTLQPGTTYHYRVLAARGIPSEDTIEWEPPIVYGADQTFTTPEEEELPTIDKESVSGITPTNAALEAQISPHSGNGADYQFQLVTDPKEYASEILCPEPPFGHALCLGAPAAEGVLPIRYVFEEAHQVSLDLSSIGVTLQPGTTYHYRVLAARSALTEDTIEWEPPIVIGADQTFTTLSETPAGPPLTLNIEEGEGTVVSNPAGLICTGAAPHECTTEEIAEGAVTLTASPATGHLFKSWKGCNSVSGRQCTVNLTKAKTVGAKFTPSKDLTVDVSGSGKVAANPGGASCSLRCASITAAYKKGTAVTLAATPSKHFHFVGWSGNCPGSCTMSADREATASFAEDPRYALSISKEDGGQAQIKTKPIGIDCGYTCQGAEAEFFASEESEVTVTLSKGTEEVIWVKGAGGCTEGGHQLSCKVPMGSAQELVAKFE